MCVRLCSLERKRSFDRPQALTEGTASPQARHCVAILSREQTRLCSFASLQLSFLMMQRGG